MSFLKTLFAAFVLVLVSAPTFAAENTLPFTVNGNVETETAHYFRGFNRIDTGYILTQDFGITAKPIDTIAGISVVPHISVFNMFADAPDTGDSSNWTEFDATPGVELRYGNWSIDFVYTWRTYPDDAFKDGQEVGAVLKYSDNGFGLLPFSLNPFVAVYQETNNNEGTYAEAGVAPSFKLTDKITLTTPVKVGTSLHDYYVDVNGKDDFLGYTSIEAQLSYALNKNWSVYAGVEYIRLIADTLKDANGEDNEFVGRVGIAFQY